MIMNGHLVRECLARLLTELLRAVFQSSRLPGVRIMLFVDSESSQLPPGHAQVLFP